MQAAVRGKQAVLLPGTWQAVLQRLSSGASHLSPRLRDEDVPRADVPIVKGVVRVEIDVRLAARDQGEFDARRIRLHDLRRLQLLDPARALVRLARPALR